MENLCIKIDASVGFEVVEGVRQCGLNKSKAWQIKKSLGRRLENYLLKKLNSIIFK